MQINPNYTVKAFTIVEAVVSMAITAIILSIIFVVFSITSQRLYDFKKQNEQITDLTRMSYSINKGIFEAENMYVQERRLIFTGYESSKTVFTFTNEYFIMQREDFTDTFHLAVNKLAVDTLSSLSKKSIYQRLKCSVIIDNNKTDLNFYKKIYTAELIKPIILK